MCLNIFTVAWKYTQIQPTRQLGKKKPYCYENKWKHDKNTCHFCCLLVFIFPSGRRRLCGPGEWVSAGMAVEKRSARFCCLVLSPLRYASHCQINIIYNIFIHYKYSLKFKPSWRFWWTREETYNPSVLQYRDTLDYDCSSVLDNT